MVTKGANWHQRASIVYPDVYEFESSATAGNIVRKLKKYYDTNADPEKRFNKKGNTIFFYEFEDNIRLRMLVNAYYRQRTSNKSHPLWKGCDIEVNKEFLLDYTKRFHNKSKPFDNYGNESIDKGLTIEQATQFDKDDLNIVVDLCPSIIKEGTFKPILLCHDVPKIKGIKF